ncbi:MAG: sugar transferase [Phycisphaerae bacterium]|nr:sugar transferase [Phycisphaerae bacterium]
MSLAVFLDDPAMPDGHLVPWALANPVLCGMVRAWAGRAIDPEARARSTILGETAERDVPWAVPEGWQVAESGGPVVRFSGDLRWDPRWAQGGHWLHLSNGRFAAPLKVPLLERILGGTSASAVAIWAREDLAGYHERVLHARDGSVMGFRRFYEDGVEPVPMPAAWPHHLWVRAAHAERVFEQGRVPRDFSELVEAWLRRGVACQAFEVGGLAYDLGTAEGLWSLFVSRAPHTDHVPLGWTLVQSRGQDSCPDRGRRIGKVWVGPDARIGSDCVLVGPSLIAEGVRIEDHAVVVSSIIGPSVVISADRTVQDSVVTDAADRPVRFRSRPVTASGGFRTWPWYAYARYPKRVVDIVIAGLILILLAPILPVIALAVKLSSPGPVFFGHRREGLRGRPFRCLKFRSMRMGADEIQEKLRAVSEVDGPQFKMADDPRITRVGHFLRETYLDEIPQFINVLAGHMSVIGPRPSPKAENTLCPSWRNARLSVRPGVTGLWQIRRTREPMRDFQEWIVYDTEYVQGLCLWLDAKIFWKTFVRLIVKFGEQF